MRQLYLLLLCLGLGTAAVAQNYPSMEQFGKNRIQYRTFDWKIVRTSNFEIYFYEDGEQIANLAAQYAESDFDRITELLGYTPYNRIKLFLYNSPEELAQSNIGAAPLGDLNRKEVDLSKSRVELAFTGDQVSFRRQLLRDVSMLYVYDMLYGGSLKDALQSSLLLTLPDWFMPGMAAYVAEGWSAELDDYIRDASINRPIRKPSNLTGIEAERVGQSIWNYIGQKYGRDNISNILNLTRIIRNEQSSIQSTLGIPYNRFLRDWRDYYTNQASPFTAAFKANPDDFRITLSNSKTPVQLNSLKLSPDKQYFAYSTVRDGKYKVEVVNTTTKKSFSILSGGYRLDGISYRPNTPLISWQRDNRLVILVEERGHPYLYIYADLDKRPKLVLNQQISGLSQISSIDASVDGGSLILSAVRKGQNDLFLYSLNRNNYQQLTNDLYDDLNPRFVGRSGRQIVFSSNRYQDTLNVDKGSYKTIRDQFSLYAMEATPRTTSVRRITDSLARATMPLPLNENQVYYLSDRNGIRTLYKRSIEEQTDAVVTSLPTSIMHYDYVPANGGFVYSAMQNGAIHIGFRAKLTESSADVPMTQRAISLGLNVKPVPKAAPVAQRDTTAVPRRDTVAVAKPQPQSAVAPSLPPRMTLAPGEVDTENYEFDPDVLKAAEYRQRRTAATTLGSTTTQSPGLPRSRRRENVTVRGPFNYNGLFVASDSKSAFRVDPIRGFGYSQNIALNDLLENHIVKAGFFVTFNQLRNSDLWFEYQNLTHRVDFGLRVDRNTLFVDANEFSQRYRYNRVALTASYPISVNTRLSVSPNFTMTRQIDLSFQGKPDRVSDYAGARAELVFDNTKINGMNMLEGSRFKLRYDNYAGLASSRESFNRITADVRHYQRIYRDLVLALRLSYSQSGGAAPKESVLGGMENWVNNSKEPTSRNPLLLPVGYNVRNAFFLEFVAPLRGFALGKVTGTSHLLANAELRFPLVRLLYQGNITSNFLRNLQFVGFSDIGTAWTGGSGPLSRENSLNTTVIEAPVGSSSPFRAKVTNFKNPFLIGYGVGARTMLLGYYVKFDYAWGLENNVVNKPIGYLTLGYDF
ncbi:hypothetical protein [Fibrella aquatilis]|uniref:Translocation protein TolB n=1 Tax=Fibrella aquatilis TaxID=2817059 RepID=A0A939G5U1_9BACT|nr:hypothetical protein [Fibrella aquatilis]MBO0930576.1 hypothetical protein [Fibrella aquatilis]